MSKWVGVMGCGWLGMPLALKLLEDGYSLKGTTTSESKLKILEAEGIRGYRILLSQDAVVGPIDEFLHELDILVINVPPRMRKDPGNDYFGQMTRLKKSIKKAGIDKIVFVSSTSVYGDISGEIDESSEVMPLTKSAKALVASESLFISDPELHTTIVRFGGLIGPDRHPVAMLSGRKNLNNGNDALNLIHLNDCILVLKNIINYGWWGEIFNAVYPDHPRKMDYYSEEATKRKLEPPKYIDEPGMLTGKIVLSRNYLEKNQRYTTPIRT